MTRTKITGLLLGVLTIASLGCQDKPPFVPVEGTITKGGKPLAGVIVDFYPEPGSRGPRSTSAPTDKMGHYRLRSTWGGEDGAIVGPHRVCLLDAGDPPRNLLGNLMRKETSSEEAQKKRKEPKKAAAAPCRVQSSYGRFPETPLRAEVGPGSQSLDFDVP